MKKLKQEKQEKLEKIKNLRKVLGGTKEYPTFTQTGEPNTSTSDSDMIMDS